ncbi:alpha/beta hydrolase [Kitasatospora sp. YST-16]|uniref:alpha/beta fold hydrolase n=1 Tax=Kitasatospora sp. YST-16 TaxID=2998080 RepID=UPI002284421E|nr:alpha/beta hydrolase [Kitasatospora sp. YST-16]WAL70849.1 alpha/beta hydrolase [Kitasatospora sp. YST-16]WNW36884.1 alpha/beta hydrolase [Streptomyces sp. Li-HN-5-13]
MAELLAPVPGGTPATALLDDGAGPPLLLVHGSAGSPADWDGVLRGLGGFRTARVRRRRYLPGPGPVPAHPVAVEAADVLAVAALLDRPPLLVGHSSGATVALEAAAARPATFAGLVLYEPPLPVDGPVGGGASRRARAALAAGDRAGAMRIHLGENAGMPPALLEAVFADPAERERLAAGADAQFADLDAIDALGPGTDRYRHLALPVTLLEGADSPRHLRHTLTALAAALPDARRVTLPGQGHTAHVTGPHLLAAEIRAAAQRAFA